MYQKKKKRLNIAGHPRTLGQFLKRCVIYIPRMLKEKIEKKIFEVIIQVLMKYNGQQKK